MFIPILMIRLCCVLAYLALAVPLPFVLLDHELGLLTGAQRIRPWTITPGSTMWPGRGRCRRKVPLVPRMCTRLMLARFNSSAILLPSRFLPVVLLLPPAGNAQSTHVGTARCEVEPPGVCRCGNNCHHRFEPWRGRTASRGGLS